MRSDVFLREAVYHNSCHGDVYGLGGGEAIVKLRCAKNNADKCVLYCADKYRMIKGEKEASVHGMTKYASDELFDYYSVSISIMPMPVVYYFEIMFGDKSIYYGNFKFSDAVPSECSFTFAFPVISNADVLDVPQWMNSAICYHVFPDRFCRGRSFTETQNCMPWETNIAHRNFTGGTLDGITSRLDYLSDLGINVIYLTPVFLSNSYHRYNTFDYYTIDPSLGSKQDLQNLVRESHLRGIRVILDAVFNHSGLEFFAFADVLRNQSSSKYADWFYIYSWPLSAHETDNPGYATFGYNYKFPKLNFNNADVRDYFLNVMRYWIKEADVDGYRLDVSDEVECHFWREARTMLRSVKHDAVLIGEVWYDSRRWLCGDMFDSVMNYPFWGAVTDFFAKRKINAEEFSHRLSSVRAAYPLQAQYALWNMIDSNDTERFLFSAGGDVERMKLAIVFQFTYPGSPAIFYGDEVGLTGDVPPFNRQCIQWDAHDWNTDILSFYKRIIDIRKSSTAFSCGNFSVIDADTMTGLYSFSRSHNGDEFHVYINNGDADIELDAGENALDCISEKIFSGAFALKSRTAVILKIYRDVR